MIVTITAITAPKSKKLGISLLLALLAALLPTQAKPTEAHGSGVIIGGVPSVKQWYGLSCEYAAAAAVTLFWGDELVGQDHFISEIPQHPNPHRGFRGNIYGVVGGIEDYGVYAEPLVPVLESHGYQAEAFYSGVARLKAEVDQGHPIVVWLTGGKNQQRPIYRESYKGETFKLVPYEHTVVVYGYDNEGVYVMDVGDGGKYYTDWDNFLRRWNYFDQMALLIHPR